MKKRSQASSDGKLLKVNLPNYKTFYSKGRKENQNEYENQTMEELSLRFLSDQLFFNEWSYSGSCRES
jgi:hypothetical protein